MYTIPPYLPHEEKAGLFSLPRPGRGVAALMVLGVTLLIAGALPLHLSFPLMVASGMLAGAEFLPARLWLVRGGLRVGSILAFAMAAGIMMGQMFGPSNLPQVHQTLCGCLI
jgi:hypothetical protein